MKYSKYSVVIIGSGVSGLYLALKVASQKHLKDGVLVITKSDLEDSNSRLAQGGIVAVLPEFNKADSISSHVSDTIKAGCGLNDFNVVKFISQNSSAAIQDLIKLGVDFDKTDEGKLSFALEAAHSVPRILHIKDYTGRAIEDALCQRVRECEDIEVYEHTIAVEILVDSTNSAKGVVVYNRETDEYEAVYSNSVVIATGGIGQIYAHTTNPAQTTGDGIALAYRAGAKVKDMEFVQFHPTALAVNNTLSMPLVSEAVRGAGAKLCDSQGNYFAAKFNPKGELAPRDVVARAIFTTMLENNDDNVFLDVSQMGLEYFKNRFPSISKSCKDSGVDISDGLIPVAPAAHYFMGGIETNIVGETNIENLYAIGEASCSGFHGANRLASNSLLECVVSAYELADYLSERNLDAPKNFDEKVKAILDKYVQETDNVCEFNDMDIEDIKNKIKNTMWENVGIVRNKERLLKAQSELEDISKIISSSTCAHIGDCYEVKNMLLVANLVTKAALKRENSVGAHFREDFPQGDMKSEEKTNLCEKSDSEVENGKIFAE